MINIKEVINFEYKKQKDGLQRKFLKALIYLFVIMFILTFLSRFAKSLTVPIVKTTSVTQGQIINSVPLTGVIQDSKDVDISCVSEIEVSNVDVKVGSSVKKGDTLFELSKDSLNKKVTDLQSQISAKQKAISRAQEDYNYAVEAEDQKIKSAYDEMKSAEGTDRYDELKSAYDTAVNKKSFNLLTSKRELEDAQNDSALKDLNSSLSIYKNVLQNDGKITSTVEGSVSKISIVKGQATTAAAAVSIADSSSGLKFVGQIPSTDAKDIKVGQAVTNQEAFSNSSSDLVVNSITVNDQDKNTYDVTVLIPNSDYKIGDSLSLNIIKSQKNSYECVPIQALRPDGDKYFVLVIQKKDSVLGTIKVAEKVDVNIDKNSKDSNNVALDGSNINPDDKVILSSNKQVNKGDEVRMED